MFVRELSGLTHLALDEDKGNYDFREIYNPHSGKPDGGYQAWGEDRPNFHWESCKLQTWSATAYLSMILNGVFGMRFTADSLLLAPFLPNDIASIELRNLAYRDSQLDIAITGRGHTVASFTVDGKEQLEHSLVSSLRGKHRVEIALH